jgi:hypothetical protein
MKEFKIFPNKRFTRAKAVKHKFKRRERPQGAKNGKESITTICMRRIDTIQSCRMCVPYRGVRVKGMDGSVNPKVG